MSASHEYEIQGMTVIELEKAVHNAAMYMDQHYSGWEYKIDLPSLHIYDPQTCIMGQIVGDYGKGMHELAKAHGWSDMYIAQDDETYEAFKKEIECAFYDDRATPFWKNEINMRRDFVDRELDLKRSFADALVTV